jgi:nucleotide-binding universal stress UspA family protein
MKTAEIGARVMLKNILYLTDFSEPAERALPYVAALAREHGAKVITLHVIQPFAYANVTPESTVAVLQAQEEQAADEMRVVEAALHGLPHESIVERELGVWPALERVTRAYKIDLIVAGTHGRTGAGRLMFGSVAETVFRQSRVPVLTIGPANGAGTHGGGKFRRILFATDFTLASAAATPYAMSLAEENQAHLVLLHVLRPPGNGDNPKAKEEMTLNALRNMIPEDAANWCKPEVVVRYGRPAETILNMAKRENADLIVLGVRGAPHHLGPATHVERATAHEIVAHAPCPVLTVRVEM